MFKLRNMSLWLVVLLNLTCVLQVPAEPKFALVIGNAKYREVTPLRNPANDAIDIAMVLKNLGFTVECLIDANQNDMEDAIVRFSKLLALNIESTGIFYYAGHGVQSGGNNYLIPVDAHIPSESFLKSKSVNLQDILDSLNESHNALNIVILDACRDNPFPWSRSMTRGLSVVGKQPSGSIIIYATSAGSTALDGGGRNGIFTEQLLKYLPVQGLEIRDIFNNVGAGVQSATQNRQIPAVYSQYFGQYYLVPKEKPTQANVVPLNAGNDIRQDSSVFQTSPGSGETIGWIELPKEIDLRADIRIDDINVRPQNGMIAVLMGTHSFKLRHPFYTPYEASITIENGKSIMLEINQFSLSELGKQYASLILKKETLLNQKKKKTILGWGLLIGGAAFGAIGGYSASQSPIENNNAIALFASIGIGMMVGGLIQFPIANQMNQSIDEINRQILKLELLQ